jgi:hypothetical protein
MRIKGYVHMKKNKFKKQFITLIKKDDCMSKEEISDIKHFMNWLSLLKTAIICRFALLRIRLSRKG